MACERVKPTYQIEKNEIDRACSMYRERRDVYMVLVERKRPLENQSVDGKVILRWIFRMWDVVA